MVRVGNEATGARSTHGPHVFVQKAANFTGVTHFERSARRCQARLSLRGEAAVARHKSAEHAFRREVVCYPALAKIFHNIATAIPRDIWR